MIVRDRWVPGMPVPMTGPVGLGQVPAYGTAAWWYQQLRALATAMAQARQRGEDAARRGDASGVAVEAQNVENMRPVFQSLRARYLEAGAQEDPDTLTAVDRVILRAGEWVSASVQAIPTVVTAVPLAMLEAGRRLTDALGSLARAMSRQVGGLVWTAVLPLAGLALVLVFVAGRAEKTRTYQRYVA